ncbi:anhydro-N-acetylmuramic acid kinase [Kangiella aquimarina]|uniref:Anhydro-N-acetylmuramic acid kinase n=1 Tax=Kangiella aquimarina TaxID=261965 RepID=A0ABZ0X4I9_9GAMM|nr:anhydro-N-acetylmuramic acid kinase [Kangiella aquimarina]WQG85286.1 anhydro-N-acetylmuramic acid kinase [Kangiella aquimarina]
MALYIGLMSGTSVDAIDAVLCDIDNSSANPIQLLHTKSVPFPKVIQQQIHSLSNAEYAHDPIEEMALLDRELGELFAESVDDLLKDSGHIKNDILAIGSHGQTIRHRPDAYHPFSIQIGNPHTIAARTGITTVADFRTRDMVYGGQGAPLVPAFHQAIFHEPEQDRVIVNLGGIANITYLPAQGEVLGYDTGPANTVMDQWIGLHQHKSFDENGQWASQGKVIPELLQELLSDDYFAQSYPKSTGREHFNLTWLKQFDVDSYAPEDVQATLLELTAKTVSQAIQQHTTDATVILCGGGAYNSALVDNLQQNLKGFTIQTSQEFGIAPDWIEAMAFAWLAHRCLNRLSGNLPAVTGAKRPTILGAIFSP